MRRRVRLSRFSVAYLNALARFVAVVLAAAGTLIVTVRAGWC